MISVNNLDDKYFKKYNLFNYDIILLHIIVEKLIYTANLRDSYICSIKINIDYIDKYNKYLTNNIIIGKTLNKTYNYQNFIIQKYYKKKSLAIFSTPSTGYGFNETNYLIDIFVLYNKTYDELSKNKYMNKFKLIKNINNIYSSYYFDDFKNTIIELKNNKFNNKYKLVCINPGYSLGLSLLSSYKLLLKLSDIISSLGIAFKTLETGGTLLLFWTIINVHVPSVQKILHLLAFAFDSVRVITDDINQNFFQGVTEYYLECKGYKANVSEALINRLLDIGIETIDYTYDICDVLDYYNQYSIENPDQCLFYKNIPNNQSRVVSRKHSGIKSKTLKNTNKGLSISKFLLSGKSGKSGKSSTLIKLTKKSGKAKHIEPIKYIEDFDLPGWETILADVDVGYKFMILSNRLESIFIEFFEKVNNMIANDLETDEQGNMKVKESAIIQRKVNDIRRFVYMLDSNKIVYNKHILTILKEQEDELLDNFYSLDNTINTSLVKYRDEQSRILIKRGYSGFKLCKGYGMDILDSYYNRINLAYQIKEHLLESLGLDRAPPIIRSGYEDFTRNLPQYLTQRYNATLPAIKISNGFTKLWEILTVFDLIPTGKKSNSFRTFHICEAPGQMIISLKYFIEHKRRNITDYDWRANSLNPYNKMNKDAYGEVKIFGDDYGLIRENPRKWIWGEDNTGDITRVENIKWYREYIKNKFLDKNKEKDKEYEKLDLIVGDGGINTGLDPLMLQKLDLAQALMVLACSSKGGACVIKHFTPYIKRHTGTYEASGFFLGFIYLYYVAFEELSLFKPYTSNPDSGEFYVIGEGFRGIDDNELERLYKILDKMELNDGLIPKDALPETFLAQMNVFLEKMSGLNSMAIEKQNLLLTCYKDGQNPKIKKYLKCDNFLDKDNLQNIQIPRFNEWIKKYRFI
jgi:hypothetical protein